MWKIGIFRIHPVANLKATCIWQKHTAFESEKIAFALSCMKLHFVSHMTLALFVYLENHQLHTVAAECGYCLENHHNALADAEACAWIAREIL